jgi:YVTN family beta-propeller protein
MLSFIRSGLFRHRTLSAVLFIVVSVAAGLSVTVANNDESLSDVANTAPPDSMGPVQDPEANTARITRKGVTVEFNVTPTDGRKSSDEIVEGEFADIEFRISGAENGEPLRGVYPGVWVDLTQTSDGEKSGTAFDCKTRVSQYLQGLVGMRPMIDLNSYYVLVMNRDASISVIDPVVGITGITSLYTSIPLTRPAADWTKTTDEKTLFVTQPRAGEVAVIDLDTFKVTQNIPAGDMPTRVVLQPDEKYLWIGNDTESGKPGGVTVIDVDSKQVIATINTGDGHHEIVFSADSRSAFVSNRDTGTVSIIDVASLKKVEDVETGPVPISLAYSALSRSVYVADGETGNVEVLSGEHRKHIAQISARAGLGPMGFSEDGRWGVLVNPVANEAYVIDASTNEIAHTIPVENKPFQVNFSSTFAYIRALDSERISMINLQELDRGGQVIVNEFAAGRYPPGQVEDVSIAQGMVSAAQEAAVLVVSPADATVYYYMEGMNAPMGAFRNYGHKPRAVQIANRALKEIQPGTYSATVKVPFGGTFEIAFLNETPQFLHCFTMNAKANPNLRQNLKSVAIEYLNDERRVKAGEPMKLRFRLTDPSTGEYRIDLPDVRVKYFRAPRYGLTELRASHVGDGIYEAELNLRRAGAYYVYVATPSLNVQYDDLSYFTLLAVAAPAKASAR